MDHETFQDCIEACVTCARTCEHCGDACIAHPEIADCVRSCRDCAELCWACAGFMSRGSSLATAVCRVCAEACDACAAECAKHTANHCRRCAEECRKVAAYCPELEIRSQTFLTRSRIRSAFAVQTKGLGFSL